MRPESRDADLTYPEVGASAGLLEGRPPPAGYRAVRRDVRLGGAEVFGTAAAFLDRWGLHTGAGLRPAVSEPSPRVGATIVQHLPLIVAPCRVVLRIDEPQGLPAEGPAGLPGPNEPHRFGYAYGTLPGHPESGEELFLVEQFEHGTWLRIRAFSRPARWYSRIAAVPARLVQERLTDRYVAAAMRVVPPRDQRPAANGPTTLGGGPAMTA